MWPGTPHSTPTELAGLASGALIGSAWRRTELHVRVCAPCGARYAALHDDTRPEQQTQTPVPEDGDAAAPSRAAEWARDAELYDDMRAAGFTGAVYDAFIAEMWRYGVVCLQAWMYDGSIGRKCHKYRSAGKVRPTWYHREVWRTEHDVREELATDAVARAIEYFRDEVLPNGDWKPDRGSLRTYFVGACLLFFAGVYRSWATRLSREREVIRYGLQPVLYGQHLGHAAPDGVAADRDTLRRILARVRDDNALMVCALIYEQGATHKEIGERMGGLSAGTVEARLRRVRNKARRMAANGEITVTPARLSQRARGAQAAPRTRESSDRAGAGETFQTVDEELYKIRMDQEFSDRERGGR